MLVKFSEITSILVKGLHTHGIKFASQKKENKMDDTFYDLCIIGAGLFGCAAARHASANPHLKICLIGLDEPTEEEFAKRDIFSSHYDEGRIMKASFHSPAFQKLSRSSIKRLPVLEKISGIKFHNAVGFMSVGKRSNHCMKIIQDVSATVGLPLLNIYDKLFLKSIYPFLMYKDDECGFLELNGAGITNPRKMLQAQRKVASEQGCHILFDKVEDVEPLVDKYHLVETTSHGKIKARRILITTGGFTNVNKFKILPQLELYVYREMATMVRIPLSEAERLSSMTGIVYTKSDDDYGIYILPPVMYPDGWHYLKIGSQFYSQEGMQTKEEIKEWFLSNEVPGETESMAQPLFEFIPGLSHEGFFRKLCVICETATRFPYIDQVTPTVTLAVGGNGWGATTSEEIGRLAAVLSLTGAWDSEIPRTIFEIVLKK